MSKIMKLETLHWKKKKYWISFKDEVRVDFGDLRKKLLEELAKAIFNSDTGAFETGFEINNTYKSVEVKNIDEELLIKYRFLERILAEILINKIQINFRVTDYIFGYILEKVYYE